MRTIGYLIPEHHKNLSHHSLSSTTKSLTTCVMSLFHESICEIQKCLYYIATQLIRNPKCVLIKKQKCSFNYIYLFFKET